MFLCLDLFLLTHLFLLYLLFPSRISRLPLNPIILLLLPSPRLPFLFCLRLNHNSTLYHHHHLPAPIAETRAPEYALGAVRPDFDAGRCGVRAVLVDDADRVLALVEVVVAD
ncbi:hypothetical protein EX30DRAFT_343351 [Ascodesmis nigricans]|uniref:Uncharacterized protein n=1 Tax=Ascodesmis nigricans TaxID=341454 RepID=A0A4S2MS43_9PEZI|nr:hypothetical protein EX30DRAFT_343351 [Ascodesmis nigricans]